MGVAETDVKTEAFVSPPAAAGPAPEAEAPDQSWVAPAGDLAAGDSPGSDGEGALVRFQRSGKAVEVVSNQTILETAEAAGVVIPFECRAGICGQCKTRLLAGRVTMESDDALSVSERARGLILACQSHPQGNVTIDA
jgi:ferredoxin